jgi:hypothetical protein
VVAARLLDPSYKRSTSVLEGFEWRAGELLMACDTLLALHLLAI